MTAVLGLRRRWLPGQRDRERGSPSRAAHDIDAPAVRLGDPFGDGESQPRARTLAGACARRVGAPEAIEDVREIPRSDADAGVGHAENDAAVGAAELHAHRPARGGVLHGVGEQVQDQLANTRRVDRDDHRLGRRRDVDPHPRLLGEQLAEESGVRVDVATPPEPMVVSVDATRIRQLILNLLTNAVKYTPPGGTVRMQLGGADGRVILSVADTGIGIAPGDLPHIFDRFWRADSARTRTGERPGAGLGLAISKWIAEAHGGRIDVVSRPGRGTTFTVTLPREPAATKS